MKGLVIGCGESAWNFHPTEKYSFILGVNDASRFINVDGLLIVNPAESFPPERWCHIQEFEGPVYSHHTLEELPVKRLVSIRLGEKHRCDLDSPDLDYSWDSAYIAVNFLYHVGCNEIDIVGVDFANHQNLQKKITSIQNDWNKLAHELTKRGVTLKNLSKKSSIWSEYILM